MGKMKGSEEMTEFDKKQLSTAMEDVTALIQQYADAHKYSDASAADILKYTLLCEIATSLKSIDQTLEAMLWPHKKRLYTQATQV